jgi:chromosome segregation ATPase
MSTVNLKKKLKALNYPAEFSDDSADLVDRLLGDLIRASEAYQLLKRESSKQSSIAKPDDKTLQNHIQVLQRENNELHTKLISTEEKLLVYDVTSKKLTQENKELSGLLKFMQKGGKINNNENSIDEINTVHKKTLRDPESTNTENISKIDSLEKVNESLKAEITRLRNMYEGQFKYDNIEAQGRNLAKEQQKEKDEAFTSQMNFLVQRNEELEQMVKGFQNSKLPQLSKELDRVKESLNNEIEQKKELQKIIDKTEQQLKLANEQAGQIYQSQTPGYLNKIADDLQSKLADKNDEILIKDKELTRIRKSFQENEQRLDVLQRQANDANSAFEIQKKQFEDLEKTSHDKMILISEKDFELQTLNYKMKFFENQIDDLNKKNEENEQKVNNLSVNNGSLKNEMQNISLSLRKATFDLEQSRLIINQKLEMEQKLMEKISNLELELKRQESISGNKDNARYLSQSQEKRIENLEANLTFKEEEIRNLNSLINKKEIEIFEKDHKMTSSEQMLNEKSMQLKIFENERDQLREVVLKSKEELKDKGILEKDLELTKKKLHHLQENSSKNSSFEEELRSLRIEHQILMDRYKQIESSLNESLGQNKVLQEQQLLKDADFRTKITENCQLQIKIKSLEEEIALTLRKVNDHEQTICILQQRGQKVNSEIQSKSISMVETQKLIIEKESLNSVLADEIKKKSTLIESLKEEREGTAKDLKSKLDELDSLNSLFGKTKRQLELETEKQNFLAQTIHQLEERLQTSSKLNSELKEENSRLGKLLNSISLQKEELLKNEARDSKRRPVDFESQLEESQRDCQKLREQIKYFTETENDLKTRLMRLDQAKDELQEQLDDKTVQLERTSSRLDKMSNDAIIFTEERTKLEQIVSQLSYKLESISEEKGHASNEVELFKDELKLFKTKTSRLEREKNDLVSDLQILAAENRSLSNELMVMSKRVESYDKKIENKNEEIKKREFDLSATGLENSQLKSNCKLFEQENYSLKQNFAKLQSNYENLQKAFRNLEQQLEACNFELSSLEKQKEALLYEISSLQNSYNRISVELQSKEINKIDKDQEGRVLQQKVENLELSNGRLQKDLAEKQKTASALINDYNELKQNFLFVKSKNDELVSKYTSEMKKSGELERSLADERSRHASILGSIYKNKAIASEVESKIESVEKMINYK